jgi:predicted ATPase
MYLKSIELLRHNIPDEKIYPYNLKSVEVLDRVKFDPKVTFIVGDNGSGKSTLLEAIAVAYGFNAEGGTKNFTFNTKETHSDLSNFLRITKGVAAPKDGFFFRAETFYNLATNVDELEATGSYGGKSLHAQSHGESFMTLFMTRFWGNGLYILDEPEAALSPIRQMALLARIDDLVQKNSQFIIATHSPIVLAYPNATILNVDDAYNEIEYTETSHYQVTKQFINDPNGMLKVLLEKEKV